MKHFWLVLAMLGLLFSTGIPAFGNDKKPAAFGALEEMSAPQAQEKVAAWLQEVGKSDRATTQKLEAIWKDNQRSVLDRLADSFALGDPVAAKLMAEARDANAPAPLTLPEVFKNEKTSAFYRANLALIYARSLTNRRIYEQGLDTLKLFSADQVVDPVSYLFNRAVCEHALQLKSDATKTVQRLLGEGEAISPDRYKAVAALILLDMHMWKDKDLGDIARKMENVERRLEIARGGPETQRQQRELLRRLDEIIKDLENRKKPPGPGNPGDGDGDGNDPGDPNGVNPPKTHAKDAWDPGGFSKGDFELKKFQKLVADWGRLPPREQRRALQEITAGMSPHHREAIENYFRSLTNPSLKR